MGAKESGQSFIAGVLAKLPEADRAAAQALFSKPEAEAAVIAIGDGTLARSDYSKNMDDLVKKTKDIDDRNASLTDWWEQNKDALQDYVTIKPEYDRLKAGGGHPNPEPVKPAPVAAGPTQEQILEQLEARDRSFANALALGMNLASTHLHMFNEPLNMAELLSDPKLGRPIQGDPNGRVYGLQEAYTTKHGSRVQEKQQAAEQARIQKLVDEKVAEKMRAQPQMPYPLRDPSPSPLDALTAVDRKTSDYTVDTAAAEYDRLSQIRQQAGT